MKKGLICLLVLSVMGTACSSHTNTTVSAKPIHNTIEVKFTRNDTVLMDTSVPMAETTTPIHISNTQITPYRKSIEYNQQNLVTREVKENLVTGPVVSIQSKDIGENKLLINLALNYTELLEMRKFQVASAKDTYTEFPTTHIQKTEYKGVVPDGVETVVYKNTVSPQNVGVSAPVKNNTTYLYQLTITPHK
jgi:hypothetical protein